jgi:hypothetical protein
MKLPFLHFNHLPPLTDCRLRLPHSYVPRGAVQLACDLDLLGERVVLEFVRVDVGASDLPDLVHGFVGHRGKRMWMDGRTGAKCRSCRAGSCMRFRVQFDSAGLTSTTHTAYCVQRRGERSAYRKEGVYE